MQTSYIYAGGSAGVLSTKLLPQEKIMRMAESETIGEALKILLEAGYADGVAVDSADFESVLAEQMKAAAVFVRDCSPEPAATDCFLLQTDYRNAKIIMKSKYSRKQPSYLTEGGVYDAAEMSQKLFVDDYDGLPEEMAEALGHIDAEFYNGNRKPAVIDIALDKAYYRQVFALVKKCKSGSVKDYFIADADMKNLLNFFRVKKAGLDKGYFDGLFLEGGSIDADFFDGLFADETANAADALDGGKYNEFVNIVLEEFDEGGAFSKSETYALNFKNNIIAPYRNNLDGIEPLISYYLAKQTETENVRLILVCLKNGVPRGEIKKRLRDLYV